MDISAGDSGPYVGDTMAVHVMEKKADSHIYVRRCRNGSVSNCSLRISGATYLLTDSI